MDARGRGDDSPRRAIGGDGPAAQVLKTFNTPHGGKLSLVRVWRGTIKDGDTVNGERVGGMYHMTGRPAGQGRQRRGRRHRRVRPARERAHRRYPGSRPGRAPGHRRLPAPNPCRGFTGSRSTPPARGRGQDVDRAAADPRRGPLGRVRSRTRKSTSRAVGPGRHAHRTLRSTNEEPLRRRGDDRASRACRIARRSESRSPSMAASSARPAAAACSATFRSTSSPGPRRRASSSSTR